MMLTEPCRAWEQDWPSVHTCDDPLACAINALIAGPDPRVEQLERLHEVLDRVEEIVTTSKSKMAAEILMLLHTARGGPR